MIRRVLGGGRGHVAALISFCAAVIVAGAPAAAQLRAAPLYGAPPDGLEARLDRLVDAYPDHLSHHDGVRLYWRDGSAMLISDGRDDKPWAEFLDRPDIDDMVATPYPTGPAVAPGFQRDPGRIRFEPFFDKMYGDCTAGGVALAPIRWVGGQRLMVSPVNGIAERLERVARAIEALPSQIRAAATPSAGVYNCRRIAGTGRRSVHAYGAAIDINVGYADYWRNVLIPSDDPNRPLPWRNRVPMEIVEIFEREGFIWGGRWYHYDTMHFEYRPELLPP